MKYFYIILLLITVSSCTKETIKDNAIEEPIFSNVIYLDFGGGNVQDNSWNEGKEFFVGSSGLSNSDQDKVMETVKEAFKLFRVTVTKTVAIYENTGIGNRQRVLITRSADWYSGMGAGAALIGSWGTGTPVFVFPQYANDYAPTIGKAICHELGHSLGLYHQSKYNTECTKENEYREGCIMGLYYGNSSWAIGQSSLGCEDIQDDIKQMASILSFK